MSYCTPTAVRMYVTCSRHIQWGNEHCAWWDWFLTGNVHCMFCWWRSEAVAWPRLIVHTVYGPSGMPRQECDTYGPAKSALGVVTVSTRPSCKFSPATGVWMANGIKATSPLRSYPQRTGGVIGGCYASLLSDRDSRRHVLAACTL